MVINTRLQEWCARLVELHRLTQQEPEGPAWLWRIRIKILKYLVTRYADEPIAARSTPQIDTVSSTSTTLLDRPLPDTEHPPRSQQVVRPVLDELRVLNNQRRNDEGFYPELEVFWDWWRETQCPRK